MRSPGQRSLKVHHCLGVGFRYCVRRARKLKHFRNMEEVAGVCVGKALVRLSLTWSAAAPLATRIDSQYPGKRQ